MAIAREIVEKIEAHFRDRTPHLSRTNWYVGIAANARTRLFNDHRVVENGGRWIYEEANSSDVARDAESRLHDLGYSGDSGGGSDNTVFVYAYLKTSDTVE